MRNPTRNSDKVRCQTRSDVVELRIRQHNKQLFTNKAALGPVRQIIDNRLVRFGNISFDLVNFQGPDRVSGSFATALKFAGLIQIPRIDKRW